MCKNFYPNELYPFMFMAQWPGPNVLELPNQLKTIVIKIESTEAKLIHMKIMVCAAVF